MRIFKGIQSTLSSDGNQETFFGKECDVTNLGLDQDILDNSNSEIQITIRDEEYKEVKLTMDVRLFAQMLPMIASEYDYYGFSDRDCQVLSEAGEHLLSMKRERVAT